MSRILLSIVCTLGLTSVPFQTGRADLGETREQLVARYGKPVSEEGNHLWFSAKDAPSRVTLSADGKSVGEFYGYIEDIGQKRVMEILERSSSGRPWRATKLEYPDTEMVWRYTQLDLNIRASYERHDKLHDSIYYFLTVGL